MFYAPCRLVLVVLGILTQRERMRSRAHLPAERTCALRHSPLVTRGERIKPLELALDKGLVLQNPNLTVTKSEFVNTNWLNVVTNWEIVG